MLVVLSARACSASASRPLPETGRSSQPRSRRRDRVPGHDRCPPGTRSRRGRSRSSSRCGRSSSAARATAAPSPGARGARGVAVAAVVVGGRGSPTVGRGARLAELGAVRRVRRAAHGRDDLELGLRRHRLPAREDHRAADHCAPSRALLAGDDTRSLLRRPLGRVALHHGILDRRPGPAGGPAHACSGGGSGRLGRAGRRRAGGRRRPRGRGGPADAGRGRARNRIQYLASGVMLALGGPGEIRRY